MASTWFTSDEHWGHTRILDLCARPFTSVEEMNAAMIANYQRVVQPDDTVYFLGDVFFGGKDSASQIAAQLWGRKILVLGNHDRWSKGYYRSLGFAEVVQSLEIEIQGQPVLLAHHPNIEADRYQLCGHVHEKWLHQGKVLNVGVDQHDFTPISETRVSELLFDSTENDPLQQKRAFLRLPMVERRRIMQEQADALVDTYNTPEAIAERAEWGV